MGHRDMDNQLSAISSYTSQGKRPRPVESIHPIEEDSLNIEAVFHLSKKEQPKGTSLLMYCWDCHKEDVKMHTQIWTL